MSKTANPHHKSILPHSKKVLAAAQTLKSELAWVGTNTKLATAAEDWAKLAAKMEEEGHNAVKWVACTGVLIVVLMYKEKLSKSQLKLKAEARCLC